MNGKKLCAHCNDKPTKNHGKAKYCSNGCKQRAYEIRKGIKPAAFLQKVKTTIGNNTKISNMVNPTNIQYARPTNEIQIAILQRDHWEKVWKNTEKGVFPLAAITAAALGAGFASESQKKTVCKTNPKGRRNCKTVKKPDGTPTIVGLGIGALVGYALDDFLKKNTIETAKRNYVHFRNEVVRLKRLDRQARALIEQQQLMSINGENVTIPTNHPTVVSSDYYKKQIIPELKFSPKWKYLMGNPSENFFAMVYGVRGNGKSTLCIQFADYLHRNHGKTLYLSSEQPGINKALQSLANEFDTKFDFHTKANKLNTEAAIKIIKGYSFVVIDSINHIGWSADQIELLRQKCPNTGFLCIFQSTKDGNFKGSEEFAHNSDIIIECKSMMAYQTKSRFSQPSNIPIRDNETTKQY